MDDEPSLPALDDPPADDGLEPALNRRLHRPLGRLPAAPSAPTTNSS